MKNMIITMALTLLFAMLICFQWEMNSRTWQAYSREDNAIVWQNQG